MSFYVLRRQVNGPGNEREAWTGPIRSERQAVKERDAWLDAGWDYAHVWPSSPEIRATVRTWQKQADERLGRSRNNRHR